MEKPLGSIALALSGGGYRAAAFHLGALDLLQRAGLLDDVEALSTVSGGTITGCAYALSLARGETFEEFRARLFDALGATNVIEKAIDLFGGAPPPTLSRRRSLITAAAQVYASSALIGDDRLETIAATPGHLREIAFNATEFQFGRGFRFMVSASPAVTSGGKGTAVPQAVAREVRLADVVAASSCFPGGFEPLQFPDDFVFRPQALPLALPATFPSGVALMDGGIFDNQGVASLLLAEKRKAGRFGTFIVSDTDQSDEDALLTVTRSAKRGHLTFGRAFGLSGWIALMCLISAAILAGDGVRKLAGGVLSIVDLFRILLPLLLTAGIGVFLVWLRGFIGKALDRSFPGDAAYLRRFLARMPITEGIELVRLRIHSLFVITAKVFMKRVRGQGYDRLYSDPAYEGRRVANMVYRLIGAAEATPAQREVASRANAMATTLWFDSREQLRDCFAAGQNTLCFQLLQHLAELRKNGAAEPPERVELGARLGAIWKRLQQDPYALTAANEAAR